MIADGPPAVARPRSGLASELRSLLWLQGRLLKNGLLRGDVRSRGRLLMTGLILVGVLPTLIAGTVGQLAFLRTRPPAASLIPVAVGLSLILVMWALSPLTGQPLAEAVGYVRLMHQPVSLAGLSLGNHLSGVLSLLGLVCAPLFLSTALGMARGPWGTLAGMVTMSLFMAVALGVRAVVVAVGDLATEDRRVRAAASLLTLAGFLAFYLNQLGLGDFAEMDRGPRLFQPEAWSSKLALWLPSGWAARALAAQGAGAWGAWLAWSLVLAVLAGLLVVLQARLVRRLLWGELLQAAGPRTGEVGRLWDGPIVPGLGAVRSRVLWGLLDKDVKVLARSPMTLRLAFIPVIFGFMAYRSGGVEKWDDVAPAALGIGIGAMVAFISTSLGANRFGMFDHRGTGSLLSSPADRGLVLISHALTQLAAVALIALVCGAGFAIGHGRAAVLPWTLLGALVGGLVLLGLGHLCSVRFPVFVDLDRGQQETNQASFGSVLIVLFLSPLLLAPAVAALIAGALLRPEWLAAITAGTLAYGLLCYTVLWLMARRMLRGREAELIGALVDGR